jgi:glucosamine--fructose-6-phosphate aminotransferase (isomerizing)
VSWPFLLSSCNSPSDIAPQVYMHAGREQAVASTKAFTSQVTVLGLLALWFRQLREEELVKVAGAKVHLNLPDKSNLFNALQRLPISFGMAMSVRPRCKEIAQQIVDAEHCFVLGKGYGTPIALEGALKLKEMAYLHAEGYSGGALKHGPFALIEGAGDLKKATPIIMLILDDEHANHMRTAAAEVKARGAQVFVITDNVSLAGGIDDKPVIIPSNAELTALIATLPLQLIAYELAVLRGVNPDTPRNLAKAVTTD